MFAADPSAYEYNGLHWRTVRRGLVDGDLQTRVMYYSALSWGAWQLIEEHIDDDEDLDPDRIAQQFWGIRYIDDALCRRIDGDADGNRRLGVDRCVAWGWARPAARLSRWRPRTRRNLACGPSSAC